MLEFRLQAPVTERIAIRSVAKRLFDVTGALLLIAALLPLMAVVAILLKLESRGPVLFLQPRMGSRPKRMGGAVQWEPRVFQVIKFRSMLAGADPELHEAHVKQFVSGQISPGTGRAAYKLCNDARVTRVGRFIRRWSLDELPQLFNVVLGDMSLVGPRPVPLYEAALYEGEHLDRYGALPGLTGLWQVSGRCAVGFEEMIRLDVDYIRRQSLLLDIKIIAMTIPAVLRGRGAA